MIIQCEQCRTKFRLDDEKVSDRGVKVRCAKCRHVFTVRKETEQAEVAAAPAAPFQATEEAARLSDSPVPVQHDATLSAAPAAVAFDFGSAPATAPAAADSSFDLGQTDATAATDFDFGDVSFGDLHPAAAPAAADFGEMTMVMPPKKPSEPAQDFSLDFGVEAVQTPEPAAAADADFDFGDALASGSSVSTQKVEFDFGDLQPSPAAPAGDVDLGGFDFGEATGAAAAPSSGIDTTDFSDFTGTAAPKAASDDLGFSFEEAVPQPGSVSSDNLDFSGVDFGSASPAAPSAVDTFKLEEIDFSGDTAAVIVAATETVHAGASPASAASAVDTFKLEELDFSGDTTAVAVAATETAPAGALFTPVEDSVAQQQVAATPDITFEAPTPPEEAPPLAITSRRRQSSTVSIVVGVIVVAIVGVLGYLAFSMVGKTDVPVDDGRITVRNVKAYFLPKAAAGELLVISGEALNNHKKARAALQVKGMVYGANNQPLANKTAYAGNPLTPEQLAAMSAEKIESAMNNQFGDSLANLEVQPGKTIPFTIVIMNPPKDGKEFGVEPVGSTVAASK